MEEDILTAVPASIAIKVLDHLLALLTHRSALKRRASLVALVFLVYLCISTLFTGSSRSRGRVPKRIVSRSEQEDAAALAYVPAPPTADQSRIYLQLLDLIDSRKSAFSPTAFTDAALENDATRVVGVTAVVLHWKRKRGLQLVLKHISRYPFIREVIVWNNHPGPEIKAEDFVLSSPPDSTLPPPRLRIYNSPSNMHDAGKHFACSLASYKHCYFNDDDWLNIYMDSLYVKYLECCAGGGAAGRGGSGGRIVSNTMPIIHLEHRRWRFENPDLDLHTGFTWLGTGSFAPRHLSTRFLQQQAAAPEGLTPDQALVSDMFFSLWTNNYPEQMPNDLVPIDVEGGEVGWSRGEGVDQWQVVYGNILDAARKLYDILLLEDRELCPDPFSLAPPPPESHTRAPCANDGCLFVTSMTPFPHPSSISYEERIPRKSRFWPPSNWFRSETQEIALQGTSYFDPWAIDSVKEYEAKWNEVEGGWPSDKWWVEKGSWHLAVDGKGTNTCWESWRPPEEQDYFGLTLVAPRVVKEIKLVGSHDLEYAMAWRDAGAVPDSWELLTVREDGSGGWESRHLGSPPSVKAITSKLIEVTLPLDPLVDYYGHDVPIRKIKLISRGRKRWKLTVCSFELDGWKI